MSSLCIIIPTLNEADYISDTILSIFKNQSGSINIEVIVIDSGSEDQTVQLASQHAIRIVEKPELIGKKYAILNYGASLSKSKWLLFLDADTTLPLNFDLLIAETLTRKNIVGGAFHLAFYPSSTILSLILLINKLRYTLSKDFYGDQGVFCSKVAFELVGGYPNKLILESAYLCKSLRKQGKLKLLRRLWFHLVEGLSREAP